MDTRAVCCSPGNCEWLFLSPCQQPGALGCPSPSPAGSPRARFPPSVPSSSLGPCQSPGAKGGVTQLPEWSWEGQGRDWEFSDSCACHRAAPSPLDHPPVPGGAPCWGICTRDLAHPAETSPSSHLSAANHQTRLPNQHNTPFLYPQLCLETAETDPPWAGFPAGVAVPEVQVLPWDGVLVWGSAAPAGCSPGWVSAAGQPKLSLSPHTSRSWHLRASRCAACRQKYFPSCCPPGAGDEFRKQQ